MAEMYVPERAEAQSSTSPGPDSLDSNPIPESETEGVYSLREDAVEMEASPQCPPAWENMKPWNIDELARRETPETAKILHLRPKPLNLDIHDVPGNIWSYLELEDVNYEKSIAREAHNIIVTPAMLGYHTEAQVSLWSAAQIAKRREKIEKLQGMPHEDEVAMEYYQQYTPMASLEAQFIHALLQYSRAGDFLNSTKDAVVLNLARAAVRHYHKQTTKMRAAIESKYPALVAELVQKAKNIRQAAIQ